MPLLCHWECLTSLGGTQQSKDDPTILVVTLEKWRGRRTCAGSKPHMWEVCMKGLSKGVWARKDFPYGTEEQNPGKQEAQTCEQGAQDSG